MISDGHLLTFVLAALVLVLIPGPSVLFTISRALVLGRRAGLATVLGNGTGAYLQAVAVATGLGTLLERSVAAFTVVKLVGAVYVVYLGVQAIRHRRRLASAMTTTAGAAGGLWRTARQGFVVGLTNPKTAVTFGAVMPQFVDPDGAPASLQMVLLGAIFVAIALVCDSCWALAAGSARQWFARSPRRLSQLGTTGGVAMIGIGARLAVTGRHD